VCRCAPLVSAPAVPPRGPELKNSSVLVLSLTLVGALLQSSKDKDTEESTRSPPSPSIWCALVHTHAHCTVQSTRMDLQIDPLSSVLTLGQTHNPVGTQVHTTPKDRVLKGTRTLLVGMSVLRASSCPTYLCILNPACSLLLCTSVHPFLPFPGWPPGQA
jgi:hypothetical protein